MTDEPPLKPVIWVGSSREDLREFPGPVQDQVGYALYLAQRGGKHRDAQALSGFAGAGIVEVVTDFRGDTFRAVHRDIELVKQRLREAEQIALGMEQ